MSMQQLPERETILERCKELISRRNTNGGFSDSEKVEINGLYMRVCYKSVPSCNCMDRYSDALYEIYHRIKKYRLMKPSNYKLKNNIVLHWGGDVYTNSNLTDEVAKAYLEKYPDSDYFAVIPADTNQGTDTKEGQQDTDTKSKQQEATDEERQEAIKELSEMVRTDMAQGESMTAIRDKYKGFVTEKGVKISSRMLNDAIKAAKIE